MALAELPSIAVPQAVRRRRPGGRTTVAVSGRGLADRPRV